MADNARIAKEEVVGWYEFKIHFLPTSTIDKVDLPNDNVYMYKIANLIESITGQKVEYLDNLQVRKL